MNKLNVLKKVCVLFVVCAAAAIATPAQTYDVLHNFDWTEGGNLKGLLQGSDGNLYGTATFGGANEYGTVFKVTPSGMMTTLYNFCSKGVYPHCTDGAEPLAGLVQGIDGDFYGTTFTGGANNDCDGEPCGTVFKITSDGTLTTLNSFDGSDGNEPYAGLVRGINGNFYGTTYDGGNGHGSIFMMTPSGKLTLLHSFCQGNSYYCADGELPYGGLVQGTDGNFYGTTTLGGSSDSYAYGTVFKITPEGSLTTLHTFEEADGSGPVGTLIQGADGNFFGTTAGGGANCYRCGTVFEITPSGTLTTLYNFCSQIVNGDCTDGATPDAGMSEGTDGNFYGTTEYGGNDHVDCGGAAAGCGTIFRITPSGELNTLYTFCSKESASGCVDGAEPEAMPVQDTNGMFYGTAGGGAFGSGVVFSISVGLGPFVTTNPAAGKVGSTIGILGTGLTGATSVTFNGTQTAFRVVSKTFIEAKVPSGATTGKVQVQLSNGTLSSNVPFYVLH